MVLPFPRGTQFRTFRTRSICGLTPGNIWRAACTASSWVSQLRSLFLSYLFGSHTSRPRVLRYNSALCWPSLFSIFGFGNSVISRQPFAFLPTTKVRVRSSGRHLLCRANAPTDFDFSNEVVSQKSSVAPFLYVRFQIRPVFLVEDRLGPDSRMCSVMMELRSLDDRGRRANFELEGAGWSART